MKPRRISSSLTFYFAWVLPILLLGFWTPVTILALIGYGLNAFTIYLTMATLAMWIAYLVIKPWEFKKVFLTDEGLYYKNGTRLIKPEEITYVKAKNVFKLSPITVTFDHGQESKLRFISRLTARTLELPVTTHSIVEEINELKTNANNR